MYKIRLQDKLTFKDYYSFVTQDASFLYNRSLFLLEELQKQRVILCIRTLGVDKKIHTNVDFIIVEETTGVKQILHYNTSHSHAITSIIGRVGHYELALGDEGGNISKHRLIPGMKYSCRIIKKPIFCTKHKIYMMNLCSQNRYLFVANDLGKIHIVDFDTFGFIRMVNLPCLIVQFYQLRKLDDEEFEEYHKLLNNDENTDIDFKIGIDFNDKQFTPEVVHQIKEFFKTHQENTRRFKNRNY